VVGDLLLGQLHLALAQQGAGAALAQREDRLVDDGHADAGGEADRLGQPRLGGARGAVRAGRAHGGGAHGAG
jgi:hypothetical protein